MELMVADASRLESLFDELDIRAIPEGTTPVVDAETGRRLDRTISEFNAVAAKTEILEAYVYATVATDTRDEKAQALLSEIEVVGSRISPLLARLADFVCDHDVDALCAVSGEARDHVGPLMRLAERSSHQMSEELEGLYAELSTTGASAWGRLQSDVTSQLTAEVRLPDGPRQLPMPAVRGMATDADAVDRATAVDPRDLPKQQANLAYWLSRKYRIAPEPLSALVAEAYELGPRSDLDPLLILAVAAIESGFNPFAQSPAGAQGLMQVMTKIHATKYDGFGGELAAFDPVANLRVGVSVLKECIAIKGSLEGGLRMYVGAGNSGEDGGYVGKVLAEQKRLQQVAQGQNVPFNTPNVTQVVTERVESWLEKAQRLTPFGSNKEDGER